MKHFTEIALRNVSKFNPNSTRLKAAAKYISQTEQFTVLDLGVFGKEYVLTKIGIS